MDDLAAPPQTAPVSGCRLDCVTTSSLVRGNAAICPWQFDSVANVTYAGVYGQFLDGIASVISLDVGLVLSGSCLSETDFHVRLVVATLGPILVLVALAALFYLAARRNHRSQEQWQRVRRPYFSMALLVTFLVYSSVSSTVFRVFDCESLDDGKEYLRADYSIQCTTGKHKTLKVYAGIMIMLYPICIPVLYGIILFKHREVLQDGRRSSATQSADVKVTVDLWKPYTPERYYYEVVERARRLTLTGVVVFIYPNTAAQVAVTLVLAFVFVMVSESLAPYASKQDAWLSRVGHIVVFRSMYQALVLKVDVSNESRDSQQVFGGVLLGANICMVAAVSAEATMVVCYVCGRGKEDLEESVAPGLRTTASTSSVADNWDTIDIEDAPPFKATPS